MHMKKPKLGNVIRFGKDLQNGKNWLIFRINFNIVFRFLGAGGYVRENLACTLQRKLFSVIIVE